MALEAFAVTLLRIVPRALTLQTSALNLINQLAFVHC